MTNIKRFQWVFIKDNIVEFQDNGFVRVCNSERLEEFLNELSEENEQLKQQLQSLLKLTKKIEDYTHDIQIIGDVE